MKSVFLICSFALLSFACSADEEPIDDDSNSSQNDDDDGAATDDDSEPAPTDDDGAEPAPTDDDGAEPELTDDDGAEPEPSAPPEPVEVAPEPMLTDSVGRHCASSANCEDDLTCFESSELLGGGIAMGMCSRACTEDEPCDDLGINVVCISAGPGEAGICVQACISGQEGNCYGQANQLCRPVNDEGLGICEPHCLNDAACGDGQFCDPFSTVCVDEHPAGLDLGEDCTTDEACASGICIPLTDGSPAGFCTRVCPFATRGGCGENLADPEGDPPGFFCFPLGPETAPLDPGLCRPICAVDADCPTGLACDLFEGEAAILTDVVGRPGQCLVPDAEGAMAAPAGMMEAMGMMGETAMTPEEMMGVMTSEGMVEAMGTMPRAETSMAPAEAEGRTPAPTEGGAGAATP